MCVCVCVCVCACVGGCYRPFPGPRRVDGLVAAVGMLRLIPRLLSAPPFLFQFLSLSLLLFLSLYFSPFGVGSFRDVATRRSIKEYQPLDPLS